MKFLPVLACVSVTLTLSVDPKLESEWQRFKVRYNKVYDSFDEELMRRLIFEENYNFIKNHNAKKEFDFILGMNHFGDLVNKEYQDIYLGYRRPKHATSKAARIFTGADNTDEIPEKIDWRDKGYVTPVKNQGQCGSCWAFSAVGSLEGQHFRSTGKLVSFSEQNLIDCSKAEGNDGCAGGWMDQAFQYVEDNRGLDTEASYPYLGRDAPCHYNKSTVGVTVREFVDVEPHNEEALRQAVGSQGPVSVAIDASSMFFQFYRGGVYNVPSCSRTELDHGVLVVGYGTQFQGKDFWLVKNSWGIGWGIYGYIEMSRNKRNQCGIATNASFPIVS